MESAWPSLGLGRLNLSNIIPAVSEFFKNRRKKSRSTICDGLILRMHYSWTLMVMLGAFVTVYYGWWTNEDEDGTKVDQIICANHFSATEMESQENYINICLSYSYVEDKSKPNHRRYLLFYRWISWSLLLISGAYYIPRIIAGACENQKVQQLLASIDNEEKIGQGGFKKSIARKQQTHIDARADEKNKEEEDLHTKRINDEVKLANELIDKISIREDKEGSKLKTGIVKNLLNDMAKVHKENVKETLKTNEEEKKQKETIILNLAKAADYITRKGHTSLFWNYIAVHFVALGIDLVVIGFMDFLLQGRFLKYGLYSYVWRDPDNFTDYISKTFPPFATCELNDVNKLVAQRTEKFGCHLTLMELYEKVFMFLWFWLAILTVCTIFYIIGVFIAFFTPFFRKRIFYVKHPDYSKAKDMEIQMKEVYQKYNYGDIFLLLQIRKLLTNTQMFELLMLLRDPESLRLLDDSIDAPEKPVTFVDDFTLPKDKLDANYNEP